MPAKPRNVRKNYIGAVSDRIAEQRDVESPAKPARRVKDFVLVVMAALKRSTGPAAD